MIALAALTGPLPKLGVVVVALLAAGVLLGRTRRSRALSMLGALVLAPVLLVAEIWNSPQLRIAHRHPLYALVGAAIAVVVLVAIARLVSRRPPLIGPLAVLALPFRIPIQAGGVTSNLLVPLYLVVAVGALAWLLPVLNDDAPARSTGARRARAWRCGSRDCCRCTSCCTRCRRSIRPSFDTALRQMVFFYVPFALLYRLLLDIDWTPKMIRDCLRLTIAMAVIFSLIGFVEYATKTIILNPKLVVQNDLHTYFTVNSVFFDPDIFGRFLALAMILLAVLLLYERPQREQVLAIAVLAVLWVGLLLTLSRSSLGALLVGMAVLAALRWRPSRALWIAVVVILLGAVAVAASPRTFGLNQGLNGASSGRGGLVSGGLSLFGDRPLQGWGSGSFVHEYQVHHPATATTLSASHTIPITIAAEQGLIGELAYVALVVCALVCLLRGARGDPVRSAIAAAFTALVFHTMLYADFLEDPLTWALLGIGVALALRALPAPPARPPEPATARERWRARSSAASP